MSVVAVDSACVCGGLIQGLRQCPVDFHIYRDSTYLPSVGKVIRDLLPKPEIPQDVLDNAMERGKQVDRLFADYVRGTLKAIPAGTRMDAVALFEKLRRWYDKQGFKRVEVQVLLGGTHHGGVCDFRFDGVLTDLKSVHTLRPEHELQVGGYVVLDGDMRGVTAWTQLEDGHLLHVTERFKEPRLVPVPVQASYDFEALASAWRVIQRRVGA